MIEKHPFGRTGHNSTRVLFGGAAFLTCDQDEADRTLEVLLKYGINHIDTAASYGDAELRIGAWMERYRDTFFLATKTGERTYQGARDQIRRSLERLRVDQVDLLQLHALHDPDEWEIAMGPGGALEAAIEAREEGLVRFIGVTGHGTTIPAMHLRSLERFDFDSVLMPYNFAMMRNPRYRADFEAVVALCQQRNVAIQTIKAVARGAWPTNEAGERLQTRTTWYEPLEEQTSIDRAVHWVLSRPGVYLNMVGETKLIPKVLDAASRFEAGPSDAEMEQELSAAGVTPLFT